jgi:signal transduction histidine kinase
MPAGLRSLRNKLALLFAVITAAAFALLYFVVVPQLESRLIDRELDDLERASAATLPSLEELVELPEPAVNERVRAAADDADATVTVFGAQISGVDAVEDVRSYVVSDSRAESHVPEPTGLADRVFASGERDSDVITVDGTRLARVAQPVVVGGEVVRVAVFARDVAHIEDAVGVIRNQVVLATLLALLVAVVGGYLVARGVSRRVARLERAAEEVAAGRFTGPLPVDSEDELGQLTRTFNTMQEQLAQVDRARRDFIATASHELRTPLMSLGGFVELLQDEDLDEATREEFLQAMGEQVERLQKLSVDLLDLSRLDSGAIRLRPERVDLAALARTVAREFEPATRGRDGDLSLDGVDAPIVAVCDRERTAQIMRILIDNALRHTPPGTPVTVRAARRDGVARLSVIDEGPGLGPAAAEQVFERFYTGDAARGSGLGLAIARELAERMEGRIAVSSRPGRTVFDVDLPAA